MGFGRWFGVKHEPDKGVCKERGLLLLSDMEEAETARDKKSLGDKVRTKNLNFQLLGVERKVALLSLRSGKEVTGNTVQDLARTHP